MRGASGRRKVKVFIADDSNDVVERLARVLNEVDGLELIGQAADVPEATQRIRRLHPDVVILDLQMPSGSGINMLEAIKKEQPRIKVIVFTNFPYPQYRNKCLNAGADFFLDKSDFNRIPEIFHELIDTVPPR